MKGLVVASSLTTSSKRTVSVYRQVLIVAILTILTFGVSLAPSWLGPGDAGWDWTALGLRFIASLIMAWAMFGIERRRVAASLTGVLADGFLIAVIIVLASNIGASEAYVARLPARTVATLIGIPLLLFLTHVLVRRAASGDAPAPR